MNTAASPTQAGIPMAVWNIICAVGFIGCSIGGVIYGVNLFNSTGRWGMIALAACVGLIGVLGIIRQAVFSAQARKDGIIFLVNFTLDSLPWTLAVLGLLIAGVVCFFVSPPF
jgi:hypothetical protein